MRRGCNDCAVGPVSCISGSTAPTMARSKQIVGALRQSRRLIGSRRLCCERSCMFGGNASWLVASIGDV